jgi:hypothetical protein
MASFGFFLRFNWRSGFEPVRLFRVPAPIPSPDVRLGAGFCECLRCGVQSATLVNTSSFSYRLLNNHLEAETVLILTDRAIDQDCVGNREDKICVRFVQSS